MLNKGLIFGGFNPFHYGHLHLFETGLKEVEEIDVYVGRKPLSGRLPYQTRASSVRAVIETHSLNKRMRVLDEDTRLFGMDTRKYDTLIVGSDFLNHMDPSDNTFYERERALVLSFPNIIMQVKEGFPLREAARRAITSQLIEHGNGVPHGSREIRSQFRKKVAINDLLPPECLNVIRPDINTFYLETF